MACFSQFFSRRLFQTKMVVKKRPHEKLTMGLLFRMLNDKSVAGLLGLIPRSHSLQCVRAWFAVAVLSFGAIFEN